MVEGLRLDPIRVGLSAVDSLKLNLISKELLTGDLLRLDLPRADSLRPDRIGQKPGRRRFR